MINVKSFLNDLEIIYTGHAHMNANDILKINLDPVKIEIVFHVDKNNDAKRTDYKMENDILKIKFLNFNNPMGNGLLTPWEIGRYNGRELFFTFYSRNIDNGTEYFHLCEYSFYSGKEVDNE